MNSISIYRRKFNMDGQLLLTMYIFLRFKHILKVSNNKFKVGSEAFWAIELNYELISINMDLNSNIILNPNVRSKPRVDIYPSVGTRPNFLKAMASLSYFTQSQP